MSKSIHKLGIQAVDQTGGAFSSIRSKAVKAGSQIRSMLGGALAAAGAYMGFRAMKNAVQDLGKLSDLSMKTGASVGELTKSLVAFQTMGLNLDINTLAKSFQYMTKATGRKGMEGFTETLREISAIEDPAKRGAELMKNFGRAGMEFNPLIEGGEKAIAAFTELSSLMPGVSDAAANAGDKVTDAMNIASTGVTSLWQRAIGKVCMLWADDFPGGVRAGALNAISYLEYFIKMSMNKLTHWGSKAALMMQAFWRGTFGDYTWEQAWAEYGEVSDILDHQMDKELEAIEKKRADYIEKLRNTNVDEIADILSSNPGEAAVVNSAAEKLGRSKSIRNEMMLAGSNAANRLAVQGPQWQEEKKQTKLLEKIEKNTGETADNTEETADGGNLETL